MQLYRLEIIPDEDGGNPRDDDNLGTMVCWHRRYNLGDKHNFDEPDDFWLWWKDEHPSGILLPLWLMDHSGLSISTGSFNDMWDSGQIGWMYVTREKLLEEYGGQRVTAKMRQQAMECLLSEVECYDLFLGGNVYGYRLSVATVPDDTDLTDCDEDYYNYLDWTHDGSCWGFLGDLSNIDNFIKEIEPDLPDSAVELYDDDRAAHFTRYYRAP